MPRLGVALGSAEGVPMLTHPAASNAPMATIKTGNLDIACLLLTFVHAAAAVMTNSARSCFTAPSLPRPDGTSAVTGITFSNRGRLR